MITIATHDGKFHADDVFAVATVLLSLPEGTETRIVRTRDEEVIKSADYVVDVGQVYDPKRKRFDHHQSEGAGIRKNGIPYASFGLVWEELGDKICPSAEVRDEVERKLVMFVDALDNGVEVAEGLFEGVRPYTISDYLYSYWIDESHNGEKLDRIFKRVVSLAKNLIKREIEKSARIIEEGLMVEEVYNRTEDKRLIILDSHLAWGRTLVDKPEPLIIVYPAINGSWSAQAVRKSLEGFETRILFPESWAGKKDRELIQATGVFDAVFCHRARFLAVAKSREGAIELARLALKALP